MHPVSRCQIKPTTPVLHGLHHTYAYAGAIQQLTLFWFSVKWTPGLKKERILPLRSHLFFLPILLALLASQSQFLFPFCKYLLLALLELVPGRNLTNRRMKSVLIVLFNECRHDTPGIGQ
jgi:hypothetical protein